MKRVEYMKSFVICAICIALCVVLPMVFHMIPNAGTLLSPMHIPVLLCGLICGWQFGLVCGLMGPLLSNFVTGMPPAAVLPSMMVELAVYGAATGILMKLVRTKKHSRDLYISLICAMLAGRVVAGLSRALIFSAGEYSFAVWATSYFVSSLPGIVIQLALVPVIVLALERAKLIAARYPKD